MEGTAGDSISIFPLSGPATGVTLEGMDYPLTNASLEPGDTLGFHNELIGREAKVSVEGGTLLVVQETPKTRDRVHGLQRGQVLR